MVGGKVGVVFRLVLVLVLANSHVRHYLGVVGLGSVDLSASRKAL